MKGPPREEREQFRAAAAALSPTLQPEGPCGRSPRTLPPTSLTTNHLLSSLGGGCSGTLIPSISRLLPPTLAWDSVGSQGPHSQGRWDHRPAPKAAGTGAGEGRWAEPFRDAAGPLLIFGFHFSPTMTHNNASYYIAMVTWPSIIINHRFLQTKT